jgi:zinc transport system substrate-binding protein
MGQRSNARTDKVAVVASFYPLQFVTEQIGGGHVTVTSLTKPGAEAHDFEKGLQGTVDHAVDSGTTDPHFWLDPQRYSDVVAKVISTRLSSVDPANTADYEKNSKAFETKLTALSGEFTAGLANSRRKELTTLDPIEGLTRQSAGKDYFEVMRSNLRALQAGQRCS